MKGTGFIYDYSLGWIYPRPPSEEEVLLQLSTLLSNRNSTQSEVKEILKKALPYKSKATFTQCALNLIYWPDCLKNYLETPNLTISKFDLAEMISRCLETDKTSTHFFAVQQSLFILLQYNRPQPLFIKLIPDRYPFNQHLYNVAKDLNVYDPYLERKAMQDYEAPLHQSRMVNRDWNEARNIMGDIRSGEAGAMYRDVYYILMYGEWKHLKYLIEEARTSPEADWLSAIRDYFGLAENADLQALISVINKLAMERNATLYIERYML